MNIESMTMLETKLNGYLGSRTDYDGAYGYQCVDFARKFCSDVGRPIGVFGGSAISGWESGAPFSPSRWTRVWNAHKSAGVVPQVGDVIFFDKTSGNPFGHVAIAGFGCDEKTLIVYEQNAGAGTGSGIGNDAVRRSVCGTYGAAVGRGACLGWFTPLCSSDISDRLNSLAIKEKIYDGERPYDPAIRSEAAIMLSRASGKSVASLYTGERPDEKITNYEVHVMFDRAFSKDSSGILRRQIAEQCALYAF